MTNDKLERVALKPCPFCGSANVGISTGYWGNEDGHCDWVECRGCGTQQPPISEEDADGYTKAFKLWNTRPAQPPLLIAAVNATKEEKK